MSFSGRTGAKEDQIGSVTKRSHRKSFLDERGIITNNMPNRWNGSTKNKGLYTKRNAKVAYSVCQLNELR